MTQLNVRGLTDDELVCQLKKLVGADRALSVKLLVHLGELDERGVCRALGYASTFEYAVRALHMSDAEAYLRIHAARLGRRFPRVLELFGQGELHLTAIKMLGPILTADNHLHVLERARRKSKREIELLLAELAPKPDVPARMRKLPSTQAVIVPKTEAPMGRKLAVPAPNQWRLRCKRHGLALLQRRVARGGSSSKSRWAKPHMTSSNNSRRCCVIKCQTEIWLA